MSRHTARIHVMNLVFQFPFHPDWDQTALTNATVNYLTDLPDLEGIIRNLTPDDGDRAFIEAEAYGTFAHLPQIDALIDGRLKDWGLDRIAKIDLALLRLAVYEIRYAEDITPGTAINEAVELAKVYGTDDSPSFINGVLGQVARSG